MLKNIRYIFFIAFLVFASLTSIKKVQAGCFSDYSSLCKCCEVTSITQICYQCTPIFPRTVPCSKPCIVNTATPTPTPTATPTPDPSATPTPTPTATPTPAPTPIPGIKLCHEACTQDSDCALGLKCNSGACDTDTEALIWTKLNNTSPVGTCDSGAPCPYGDGRLGIGSVSRGDRSTPELQTVLKDGSTYKMWYASWSGSMRLFYATSSDGLTWTKYDNTAPPVSDTTSTNGRLGLGSNGRGDDERIQAATILKDDDGTFKMWYAGQSNGGGTWDIYYATSPDGLTWTKYDNTIPARSNTSSTNGRVPRGLLGSADNGSATDPFVMKDGSIYKMWYSAQDGSTNNWVILYATSPDGLTWTKYDNSIPSLSNGISTNGRIPRGSGSVGDNSQTTKPMVVKDGTTYKMWYTGNGNGGTYYATSPDGLTWTKYDNSPAPATNTTSDNGRLGRGLSGSGDSFVISASKVINDGGSYKMWYIGNDSIYYATMTNTDCSDNVFQCSQACTTDANCISGLNCISNRCRESACPSEESCNCIYGPSAVSSLIDVLSNNFTSRPSKHTLWYDIRIDTVVTNGSLLVTFPSDFNFGSLASGDISVSGGDVTWGSTTVNAANRTLVIPFTGTLNKDDGQVTIKVGNSNFITNSIYPSNKLISLTSHASADGTGGSIDDVSDEIFLRSFDSEGTSSLSDTLSNSQIAFNSRHTLRYNIGTTIDITNGSLKIVLADNFKFNDLTGSDINVFGGDVVWGAATVTGNDKTVIVPFTGTLGADDVLITLIFGLENFISNPDFVGGFPVYLTSHISSDGTGAAIENLTATVAITGGVTVSATVPSSLTFTILPVASLQGINGVSTTRASTASLINFGIIEPSIPQIAAQDLQVSTNSTNGFMVTLQSLGKFTTITNEVTGYYETQKSYSLTSPNYPGDYSDDYENTWTINEPGASAISIHFDDFTTEGCCDYVELLDGSDSVVVSYAGSKGSFNSSWVTGDTVKVHFYTDSSVTYPGWSIDSYGYITDNPTPSSTFIAQEGYSLDSPNYPGNYSNDYDNTWTISKAGVSKIRIKFADFNIEDGYDFVEIRDRNDNLISSYSGNVGPFTTSWVTGDTINVRFYTDSSGTESGWSIELIEYPSVKSEADYIANFTGTNAAPISWSSPTTTHSFFGYTTSDYTLHDSLINRFQGDKWSGPSTTPSEVMYYTDPVNGVGEGLTRVGYQIEIDNLQPAGIYQTNLMYLCTATY